MDNEHRLIGLERRRRRGARLLAAGVAQAEVARRVGVTRTTVSRWEAVRQEGGLDALRRPKHFGRPRRLSDAQCEELMGLLKGGALAAGFGTELWTLPRMRTLIAQRFSVSLTEPSVWRLLRALGWSVQRPSGQARQRDEKAIRTWKAKRWPELKNSQRGKDESSSL
jgi:transposase